jgi:hypothetical protein
MGAIGGMLGLSGGASGTGFSGPQSANIIAPTNSQQVGRAYTGTQGAMGSQQALLSALQAQNGLQNQNQVYGQLQGVASGAVNPAQAQFAQNTAQNVGNQAALMAGQRGASGNVGLIARQSAQQGAGIQQQAVGQEAAIQAQNQIAAMGAAGNMATTQAGQQIGQTNANVQAQQSEQANLMNALQGYNNANVSMQSNTNMANAGLAQTQMGAQQQMIGGIMQGASMLAAAKGGEIKKMADGGDPSSAPFAGNGGPSSKFGKFLSGVGTGMAPQGQDQNQMPAAGPGALQKGMSSLIQAVGKKLKGSPQAAPGAAGPMAGGPVASMAPAAASAAPAGSALSLAALGAANGGMARDFRSGGKVKADSPKERAVSKGNDYANDKIPAVLSEHEIVLPRSVTLSKDPVKESAKFVASVIAKRRGKK